jgi:hypothetical protein
MVSRAEQRRLVWSGKMRKTTGGLGRDDLMLNKSGRIVSKRKSQAASKANNLGTWLRVRGQGFKQVPANAKKGSNGKARSGRPLPNVARKIVQQKPVGRRIPKKGAGKQSGSGKPDVRKAAKSAYAKPAQPKPKLHPQKSVGKKIPKRKKLDSKRTVVASKVRAIEKRVAKKKQFKPSQLLTKAQARARANSKAGAPLTKSKAPEIVAAKATKAAKAKQPAADDWGDLFSLDANF